MTTLKHMLANTMSPLINKDNSQFFTAKVAVLSQLTV